MSSADENYAPIIDERIWGSLDENGKIVIINIFNSELMFQLSFIIATQYKDQLANLHIDGFSNEDFKQKYAQLQYNYAFWMNLPKWVKEKNIELKSAEIARAQDLKNN